MITTFLASLALLQTQDLRATKEQDSKVETWKRACTESFKTVDGGVIVDIPIEHGQGTTFKLNQFDRFLVAMHLTASITKTRLLVYRDPSSEPMGGYRAQYELIRQLSTCDPNLLRKAATEGVLLSECPVPMQRAFLDFTSDSNTRGAFTSGVPLMFRVYEQPVGYFESPSDGSKKEVGLGYLSTSNPKERAKAAKLFASDAPSSNVLSDLLKVGLSNVENPDLDFGQGEVTTLGLINAKLRNFPESAIRYDYRFKDQPLFVKGTFTARDLGFCLTKIADAVTPERAKDIKEGLTRSHEQVMRVASQFTETDSFQGVGTLNKADYLGGGELSASELIIKSPFFKQVTKSMGLDPAQKVKLGSTLGIAVFGAKMFNGQPIESTFLISP